MAQSQPFQSGFCRSDQGFPVMANTREPILHPIPILSLHPTQMTVGMREVKEKRKRWRQHKPKKKQAELLGKHMIPVVDFLRRRISHKSVEANFAKAVEKALALAKGKDAVYLPGWCGPASDD